MTEHIGSPFPTTPSPWLPLKSLRLAFSIGYIIIIVTRAEVKAGSLSGTQVRDLSRPVSILWKGGQGGKGLLTAGQPL